MINTEKLCMGCMNDNDGAQICPICGYDSSVQNHIQALPVRFQLNNRYIVGKTLNVNGEGITYIGWDNATDSVVKIKEYFPVGIAIRNPDTTVSMVFEKKYIFNEGLLEFLEINRTIMSQPLAALQEVNDVFELNGTAYVVYQNIQGITLSDFLSRNGGTIKWEQARALLLPLFDTVKSMNDIGYIHKGISPETIIVGRDGKLRITDYSIKRLRIADADVESSLAEGYSAIEQYGIMDMKVGTWTDVYGFCATLFKVLIGTEVPKATLRLENESMSIPARFAEELPRHVLAALANGLKVKPMDRTRNIETLKNELVYGEIVTNEPVVATAQVSKPMPQKVTKSNERKSNMLRFIISVLVTVLVLGVIGYFGYKAFIKNDEKKDSSEKTSTVVSNSSSEDSSPEESEDPDSGVKLYEVPDFSGKTYAEIIADEDYKIFEISIKSKAYSSKIARGKVCKQTVEKGSEVEKGTKIQVVISLGSKTFKMPNVVGLDEQSAKLELLKAGFLYENISVGSKFDDQQDPGEILNQSPAYGETVNSDMKVTIDINTYTGETPGTEQQTQTQPQTQVPGDSTVAE